MPFIKLKKRKVAANNKLGKADTFQAMVANATLEEAATSQQALQISSEPTTHCIVDAFTADISGHSQTSADETETSELSRIGFEDPLSETEIPLSGTSTTTVDKLDEISSFFSKIYEKLSIMSDCMDNLSTKVDFMMDILQESGHHFAAGILTNDAPYPKVEDEKQLKNLETYLEDQDFKEKWIKWLGINVSRSDCAETRMLSMLDLIMSKEIQAQCSWTGASRIKGQRKICIMIFRNILAVFQRIGTTTTEIVTQEKLANFFMKKLKNAAKRASSYTGKRRSTQHAFVKRERVEAK